MRLKNKFRYITSCSRRQLRTTYARPFSDTFEKFAEIGLPEGGRSVAARNRAGTHPTGIPPDHAADTSRLLAGYVPFPFVRLLSRGVNNGPPEGRDQSAIGVEEAPEGSVTN